MLFIFSLLVLASVYFRVTEPPFQAIPSPSMEPTLQVGDLVIVRPILPSRVRVGEIIVVQLPQDIQQLYGYPPSVVHRVVQVNRTGGTLSFRTKGDHNPGQDPYTVEPGEIRGIVVRKIPYLGFLVLYLHSPQGLLFLTVSALLYLLYKVSSYAERKEYSLKRSLSAYLNGEVIGKLSEMETGQRESLARVETSLAHFADAMGEYAVHLRSHTESVRHMAGSAAALQASAEEQLLVLRGLSQLLSSGGGQGLAAATHPPAAEKPRYVVPSQPEVTREYVDFGRCPSPEDKDREYERTLAELRSLKKWFADPKGYGKAE